MMTGRFSHRLELAVSGTQPFSRSSLKAHGRPFEGTGRFSSHRRIEKQWKQRSMRLRTPTTAPGHHHHLEFMCTSPPPVKNGERCRLRVSLRRPCTCTDPDSPACMRTLQATVATASRRGTHERRYAPTKQPRARAVSERRAASEGSPRLPTGLALVREEGFTHGIFVQFCTTVWQHLVLRVRVRSGFCAVDRTNVWCCPSCFQ